jgi:hypothetical protein
MTMPGKFQFKKFTEIPLGDPFFNSLKADYVEFPKWYQKKCDSNATALVFSDDEGLGAFVYLKDENEPIELAEGNLPAASRMKIGTLRLAERYQSQRLGEGALGLALWQWMRKQSQDIYVTVFERDYTQGLIALLQRYGFRLVGHKANGECVYLKSRLSVDYSDPYKSFPFINPAFQNSGYLVVNDVYHDTLFPYSELKNTLQEQVGLHVANGFTKIYIGSPTSAYPYRTGEPLLVYRRYTGTGQKGYKSCITSYCVVTDIIVAKENGRSLFTLDEILRRIGNKSVFDPQEIRAKYSNEPNLTIVEMLYCGYFGEGNNVNWVWLKNNGFWGEGYPTSQRLSPNQFKAILAEGNVDVQNVIIN